MNFTAVFDSVWHSAFRGFGCYFWSIVVGFGTVPEIEKKNFVDKGAEGSDPAQNGTRR
jgi:hypothetical protein